MTTVVIPRIAGAVAYDPTAIGITGGNIRFLIGRAMIPFVKAPTGSMGNNGAITMGTALDRVYPHCYVHVPAGAVAAGVPAANAWLYCEMTSTTVGTVYNNTYTSGTPTIPTKVAFVTTGPGAFTGVTTEVTGPQFTMAANAMGPNGELVSSQYWTNNNSATGKTPKSTFGGTSLYAPSRTTTTSSRIDSVVKNEGSASGTNAQWSDTAELLSTGSMVGGNTQTSIDTTAAVTLAQTLTASTATDWLILVRANWYVQGDGT